MDYRRTSDTVYACQYHVVFCPKYRRKVLAHGVDERFRGLVPQILEESFEGVELIEMEAMPDHVHLLLEIPPRYAVQQVARRVKGVTSGELRFEFRRLTTKLQTLWTRSCFRCPVGGAPLDAVKDCIQDQKTSGRPNRKGKVG